MLAQKRAKECLGSKVRPSDHGAVETSAEAEEVQAVAALVAMFAVTVEDQRIVVDFAEADLTFDADRRGTLARAALPLENEAVGVVPGKEFEEEPRGRKSSLEVAPAAAGGDAEELGGVEAHCHI